LSNYFQHFSTSIEGIQPPDRFTFPFYYDPHLLSKIAVKELQYYLENQTDFEHNFGLDNSKKGLAIGKMFGVLVVENKQGEIGYISAVSGKLANTNTHKLFVPPIYDMLAPNSFFINEEQILNKLNKEIEALENNSKFIKLKQQYKATNKEAKTDINQKKAELKTSKEKRKAQREKAALTLSNEDCAALEKKLAEESLKGKYFYNNVNRYWQYTLEAIKKELSTFTERIDLLKNKRKKKSIALQEFLFKQYQFLNKDKESKNLSDLFKLTNQITPAGSGECAAPKLLQYAFKHNLRPIAMAEFWWGTSPKKEIRKHKQYYPACQGKCKPILTHMLSGITMDTNPMLKNPAIGKELEYLYEDEDLIVVNKPEEFLSVPGIHIQDSVYTRIKQQVKDISGPIIIHRLDMSTSGLLVVAKNKNAHKELQSQFINKTVEKRYTALLDGFIGKDSGVINLPLRVDLDDRPRQLVCFEYGKEAKTKWEVIERKENKTKIHFYPISGRTHQLRVHAAHQEGLNTSIIGDDLYGKKANRLHLHADTLTFTHPTSKKRITFHKEAEF
jgi:tRNA pseudouridine32 synthase/23S rRNA pseudouridine746 synthase